MPALEIAPLAGKERTDLEISATRVFIALRCFKLRHGRLPASLAELVPQYLDKVPADPYDGAPLRYSAERRIVYSVGEDLRDGGGSAKENRDQAERDRDEPTFRIEF